MVNEEVVEYISDGISQGYSSQQLRGHLIKNGFPEEIVDEAIIKANSKNYSKQGQKNVEEDSPVRKTNWKKISLWGGGILILLVVLGFILYIVFSSFN